MKFQITEIEFDFDNVEDYDHIFTEVFDVIEKELKVIQ
jgi:hypothetical protein